MRALNDCSFIGRLGRDPETKFLPNGTCVTEISIACDYSYRDKDGGNVVETNWIPITSFGKLAEMLAEYARKGNRIYVNGRFKTDRWEDGEGVTKYFTKIYMKDFIVLESKASGGNASPAQVQQNNNNFDDDIPF